MTHAELTALLATAGLADKYTTADAANAYALCLVAAKGNADRARKYFLEVLADHSYRAAVEAANPAAPALYA